MKEHDHGYRILLHRGSGVVSSMIGWQTRSGYTHASLLTPSGEIIEAWEGSGKRLWQDGGVRICPFVNADSIDAFDVPTADLDQWIEIERFMRSQVDHSYDYPAILGFVTRRDVSENEAWFCSEIIFTAFRLSDIRLLERIRSWAVHPGHLSISPLLKRRKLPDDLVYVPQFTNPPLEAYEPSFPLSYARH